VVHPCAARALAVTRVTEPTGKKTPGVAGALWETPAQNAPAGAGLGRWRGYRPAPWKRLSIPKQDGKPRPLSSPTLTARARPAVSLQALPPMAETAGAQHAYGLRPPRRCAEALGQGLKVLRPNTAAPWIWEGESPGCFANSRASWGGAHLPMHQRVRSRGLRRGGLARGTRWPTAAGVPHGGSRSPAVRTMGSDGLEAVGHGGRWPRRVHTINAARRAEDGIVTAPARQVVEAPVLPRRNAFLAARGGRLSPPPTVIPPSPRAATS
jgi:hypothetical protein